MLTGRVYLPSVRGREQEEVSALKTEVKRLLKLQVGGVGRVVPDGVN